MEMTAFRVTKGHVSHSETPCFTRQNTVFHNTLKASALYTYITDTAGIAAKESTQTGKRYENAIGTHVGHITTICLKKVINTVSTAASCHCTRT